MAKTENIATPNPACRAVIACVLALLLATVSSNGVSAAEIRFNNIVPGAGIVRMDVESIKERQFRNIVRQQTDFSCGAAALATIFQYAFNRKISEATVLAGMFRIADRNVILEKGFSLLDMKRYAIKQGFHATGYQVNVDALRNLRIPVIILLNLNGYQHFVVLKKVDGDSVYLADPALGNKKMTVKKFEQSWNGTILAIVGHGFDANTVLTKAPTPISARALMHERAPFQPANLLDFGVLNADYF